MSGMGAAALALGTQGILFPRKALAATYYPSSRGNPFTLGVASGDPRPDGFVLWTRLAPSPLSGGGMGSTGDVWVDWEVATGLSSDGQSLQNVVLSSLQSTQNGTVAKQNPAIAEYTLAHSVHLEVGVDTAKLPSSNTTYYYRLMVRDSAGNLKYASPIGRTKTTPAAGASVTQMKFAFASCQHFESGYYHAYRHMAQQNDLDLVVHVGDYLYEDGPSTGWARKYQTKSPTNLTGYRNRHAEYKYRNPELREAHAKFPWVCTWDDHEYVNNYAGSVDANSRRDAAYRAYYEHLPLRKSFRQSLSSWRNVTLYGHLEYGNLAQFCLLDTRQYRADQPCGGYSLALSCDTRFSQSQTMLDRPGATDAQLQWLLNDRLSPSRADDYTWNVLANQVIMFQLIHPYDVTGDGRDDETYYMDGWDGYAYARNRILEHLAQKGTDGKPIVPNPVVLTGDMHSSWASNLRYYTSDWRRSFDANASAETVGAEFTGTSITTWLGWPAEDDPDSWKAIYAKAFKDSRNPHVKYYDERQGGYMLCTLNGTEWKTELYAVDTFDEVESSSTSITPDLAATLTVQAGTPGLAGCLEGYSTPIKDPALGCKQ